MVARLDDGKSDFTGGEHVFAKLLLKWTPLFKGNHVKQKVLLTLFD